MGRDVCFELVVSVEDEHHGQILRSRQVQHLIDAREENGIDGKRGRFASVAAEPHGDPNVVEATLGNQAQIPVLYSSSPSALVGFAF
jgi:hypothetical protein